MSEIIERTRTDEIITLHNRNCRTFQTELRQSNQDWRITHRTEEKPKTWGLYEMGWR